MLRLTGVALALRRVPRLRLLGASCLRVIRPAQRQLRKLTL